EQNARALRGHPRQEPRVAVRGADHPGGGHALLAASRSSSASTVATTGSRWTDKLGALPFRQMATFEFEPEEVIVKKGFPFPRSGSTTITQDDFPGTARSD